MSETWLPEGAHYGLNIEHHQLEDAGEFTGGTPKLCWHTTESPQEWVDVGVGVLRDKRAAPHVIIGYRRGFKYPVAIQLIPFDRAGRALEHVPGTPETNRANVIQVEICGRAAESNGWDDNYYAALANLALLIEHRTGILRKRPRHFPGERYTGPGWIRAAGHVGHCHAPNQSEGHTDPGRFDGRKLIRLMNKGRQNLKPRRTP